METALEVELTEHLGYERHQRRGSTNNRNGTSAKTLQTDVGPVRIAKGFTTGDIVDHVADIYGSNVSKDLVSKVTDAVLDELTTWQSRPLGAVWPALFLDAIYVTIRDGQGPNRPVYVVMGINVAGERDVLGMWVGSGGEGAKHWAGCLTELANCGVAAVMIAAWDGLPGLPEAIEATRP